MQTKTCLHWLYVPTCWFDYGITNCQGMFVPFEIDEVVLDGLSIGLAQADASQLMGWCWALLFGSYFGGCSASLPDASHSVMPYDLCRSFPLHDDRTLVLYFLSRLPRHKEWMPDSLRLSVACSPFVSS